MTDARKVRDATDAELKDATLTDADQRDEVRRLQDEVRRPDPEVQPDPAECLRKTELPQKRGMLLTLSKRSTWIS